MYIPTAAARYFKTMCGCTVFVENDRSTIPLFKYSIQTPSITQLGSLGGWRGTLQVKKGAKKSGTSLPDVFPSLHVENTAVSLA